jgi:hypothetical protein
MFWKELHRTRIDRRKKNALVVRKEGIGFPSRLQCDEVGRSVGSGMMKEKRDFVVGGFVCS